MHVHETWKGHFARARARTAVAWFETKFRIEFRIIFQNICITFPLCSLEHASSILESIAASPMVAGRAFSLCEGVKVHTFALEIFNRRMRAALQLSGRRSGFLKSILQSDFVCFKFLIEQVCTF
jgi:hypothetical protein